MLKKIYLEDVDDLNAVINTKELINNDCIFFHFERESDDYRKSLNNLNRGVAQSGSAQRSGRWGRRFKSSRPDQGFTIFDN